MRIRGFLFTGLTAIAVGVTLSVPISFWTVKEVNSRIESKMDARQPFENKARASFMAIQKGDESKLEELEGMASQGLPVSTSLLWQVYQDKGLDQQRDQLVVESLERMTDPDLLFFLDFARYTFDEQYRKMVAVTEQAKSGKAAVDLEEAGKSPLSSDQLSLISECFNYLTSRYDGDGGKIRNRYAYLTDTKGCSAEHRKVREIRKANN